MWKQLDRSKSAARAEDGVNVTTVKEIDQIQRPGFFVPCQISLFFVDISRQFNLEAFPANQLHTLPDGLLVNTPGWRYHTNSSAPF
jgi:hypothetical protein